MSSSKQTKRALFSSFWALLLCFAMLLGTTFAWFTNTASTGVNKIQAGNLKIDVQYTLDGEEWADLNEASDIFAGHLWEPGHTGLVGLKIHNAGDLALKYKIGLNIVKENKGVNKANQEFKLSDYLKVSSQTSGGVAGSIVVYLAFNSPSSLLWEPETTFLSDNVICSDVPATVGSDDQYFVIKVKMPETVGNEANAIDTEHTPSIQFGINVYATQYTYESDSIDNQYDKDATYGVSVSTVEGLRNAISNSDGSTPIVLMQNIDVDNDDIVDINYQNQTAMFVIDKDTIIDLNGQALHYTSTQECWHGFYVKNGATLTIIDSSGDNSGSISSDDPEGTYIICVVGKSTVNIYGGSFHTKDGASVYKNNGYVNIYGGVFETDNHKDQLLNMGNSFRNNYPPFMIYGGSFKNFEPGVTNSPETKVADGYKVVQDGDWYKVVAK